MRLGRKRDQTKYKIEEENTWERVMKQLSTTVLASVEFRREKSSTWHVASNFLTL